MRALTILLVASTSAVAYEVDTHGRMTQTSYERSALKTDNGLLQRLGFDRLDLNLPLRSEVLLPVACISDGTPLYRDAYVDAEGTWQELAFDVDVRFRCPNDYEKRLMPPEYSGRIAPPPTLGDTPDLRFESWLMRGAIREDDLVTGHYYDALDAPDASPWGEIDRPTHHFYSPVTNTSDGVFTQSSLPWALGQIDPFAANQAPDPARENHFSYADAVRSYYLALSFRRDGAVSGAGSRTDANARMAFWAGALSSLGHTVHLLQDTAQPQHVRGEAHNYLCRGALSGLNQTTQNRTYENFSNFRVTFAYNNQVRQQGGADLFLATNSCEEKTWLELFDAANTNPPPLPTPFTTSSYPIPSFSLARKFFTTRAAGDPTTAVGLGLSQLNARAGLADYTNRGFYTPTRGTGAYLSPPPVSDPTVVQGDSATVSIPGLPGVLRHRALYWKVPDVVAPTYVDPNTDGQGRVPIASMGYWEHKGLPTSGIVLSLANYTQMADMLGPRAIAYSAGLVNYFFRGKLEVAVPDQGLIAVMNQGETHTVDSDGYPRRGNQSIFGFTKVRLKVRNTTPDITESGTATVVPQVANSGELVAVARYHRNACYATNLSGQRTQNGTAAPPAPITNPTCSALLPERTNYQEISVSAPLTINGGNALPGPAGALVDKVFDFSAQPIPVNAVDLFVQVVYRGQLGDEPDGIAVGNLDVREPTFLTIYNGSDYYWNGSVWTPGNVGTTTRAADYLHICSGSPSKLIYRLVPAGGDPQALSFLSGGINPGVVRLAVITSPPTGTRVYRGQPTMDPPPSAEPRVFTNKGTIRQAGREVASAASMAAPMDCIVEQASGIDAWCNAPAQRRRGQILGDVFQAIYYAPFGQVAMVDVDAAGLPPYPGLNVRSVGEIRFDDEPQVNCPSPPAATSTIEELTILREQAAAEGISVD